MHFILFQISLEKCQKIANNQVKIYYKNEFASHDKKFETAINFLRRYSDTSYKCYLLSKGSYSPKRHEYMSIQKLFIFDKKVYYLRRILNYYQMLFNEFETYKIIYKTNPSKLLDDSDKFKTSVNDLVEIINLDFDLIKDYITLEMLKEKFVLKNEMTRNCLITNNNDINSKIKIGSYSDLYHNLQNMENCFAEITSNIEELTNNVLTNF